MSLGNKRLNAIGEATVDKLPDGRKRVTRAWQVHNDLAAPASIEAQLFQAYGTPDGDFGADDSEISGRPSVAFPECLLVAQKLTSGRTPADQRILTKTYEELSPTAETQVGENAVTQLEDGRRAIVAEFIQLSSAAPTPGTPGTTTAPGDTSAFLQIEEATNDGALRRIRRTYVYAGTISDTTQSQNNGKLSLRTIVSVKTVPSTPDGYTLVTEDSKSPNGVPVYTYTFAKGEGELSREYALSDGGANNVPLDAAAQGVNRVTIVHLTPASVNTDPTTNPDGACVRLRIQKEERDGHRVWTVLWVNGNVGSVVTDVQTRNGGKLIVYRRVGFGVEPLAPDPTIGGAVVATSESDRKADGYVIYDRTWAEGFGEIERDEDERYGGMLRRVTIQHLTDVGTAVQPTTDPLAGGTIVSTRKSDQEGFRLWVVTWSKASNASLIVDTVQKENKGKLIIYRRERFGAAPEAPDPTIDGVVVETFSTTRLEDGFTVYVKAWAEGRGIIRERPSFPQVGLRRLDRWVMGAEADADANTPAGVLLEKDYDEAEGVTIWHVAVMQQKSGAEIVDGEVAIAWDDYVPFEYPGRAKYYSEEVTLPLGLGTGTAHNVYLSPPVKCLIEAEVQVTYQTAAALTLPATLWNPTASATLRARWVSTDFTNYHPRSKVQGLEGYNAENAGGSGTIPAANYSSSILGERVAGSSTWEIALEGGPGNPAGNEYTVGKPTLEPAFVAHDGTQWFRQVANYVAAVPAQEALPV